MRRRREATVEELALWRLATRDAAPLRGTAHPKKSVAAAPDEPPPPVAAAPPPATAPPRPPPAPSPLRPGSLADMDHRTAERLRRGRMAITARIDLHGMTQAAAHTALAAFLNRAWRNGERLVLVITGKGGGSERGGPEFGGTGRGVLRRLVPLWLADPPLRAMVVAIQPARPKDGGEGALYVLVRRRREGAEALR